MEDRLDKGDFVWNQKTGEIARKPVSLKEARGAANDLLQRQVVLEKMQREEVHQQQQQTVADQLAMLANEFAKFQTGRTIEVVPSKPKDVEDAVYEEVGETTGSNAGDQQEGIS